MISSRLHASMWLPMRSHSSMRVILASERKLRSSFSSSEMDFWKGMASHCQKKLQRHMPIFKNNSLKTNMSTAICLLSTHLTSIGQMKQRHKSGRTWSSWSTGRWVIKLSRWRPAYSIRNSLLSTELFCVSGSRTRPIIWKSIFHSANPCSKIMPTSVTGISLSRSNP